MEQTINNFIDNTNLTSQNSLTHLLDFDEEYYQWMHSMKPSLYYSDINFIENINTDSCTVMSNYDTLFARTVAYPVQVAYWIKRSWPPADTVSHVNFDQWSGDMAVGSCGLEAILA